MVLTQRDHPFEVLLRKDLQASRATPWLIAGVLIMTVFTGLIPGSRHAFDVFAMLLAVGFAMTGTRRLFRIYRENSALELLAVPMTSREIVDGLAGLLLRRGLPLCVLLLAPVGLVRAVDTPVDSGSELHWLLLEMILCLEFVVLVAYAALIALPWGRGRAEAPVLGRRLTTGAAVLVGILTASGGAVPRLLGHAGLFAWNPLDPLSLAASSLLAAVLAVVLVGLRRWALASTTVAPQAPRQATGRALPLPTRNPVLGRSLLPLLRSERPMTARLLSFVGMEIAVVALLLLSASRLGDTWSFLLGFLFLPIACARAALLAQPAFDGCDLDEWRLTRLTAEEVASGWARAASLPGLVAVAALAVVGYWLAPAVGSDYVSWTLALVIAGLACSAGGYLGVMLGLQRGGEYGVGQRLGCLALPAMFVLLGVMSSFDDAKPVPTGHAPGFFLGAFVVGSLFLVGREIAVGLSVSAAREVWEKTYRGE